MKTKHVRSRPSRTYQWPPRACFLFYTGRGRYLFSEKGPWVDLEDSLELTPPTVQLGMTCEGRGWTTWTESRLKRVEWLMKQDIEFDGDRVSIERLTAAKGQKCSREFRWKLRVWTPK
jgi:hypothetical protein